MTSRNVRKLIRELAKNEQEAIDARRYDDEVREALDAAELAIDEFYNGDKKWAETWLLKAFAVNKDIKR
ncbi:MAG: hypothetical protein ACLPTZ_06340 [Beijerinckiaceae bacterium]